MSEVVPRAVLGTVYERSHDPVWIAPLSAKRWDKVRNCRKEDTPSKVAAPDDHRDHHAPLHLPTHIRARPRKRARHTWKYAAGRDDRTRVSRARGRCPVQDRVPGEREERAGYDDRPADAEAVR